MPTMAELLAQRSAEIKIAPALAWLAALLWISVTVPLFRTASAAMSVMALAVIFFVVGVSGAARGRRGRRRTATVAVVVLLFYYGALGGYSACPPRPCVWRLRSAFSPAPSRWSRW